MRKFTKLFCTAFLLLGGFVSASAQDEIIDFDASFYHNWSEVSGTATDNGLAGGGVVIGKEVAIGGTIWGNLTGAVPYLDYANITEYSELRFEGTPGATIRLMCNRLTDEGPIYEIKPTFDENGKITVPISDLKFLNGGTPCDFVCLQSIKVPASWAGGTMPATITSIKIVKPGDPLANFKTDLKNAINAAKMRTALGKTEESWNALQKAIADAESALAAADATEESLTAAKTSVDDAVTGLTLAEGYTALTSDMFKNWEDPENPVVLSLPTVLFQATGQPYGDPSVKYFNYADISQYDKLIVGVTAGTPRIMLNRAEPLPEGSEGYDANGGAYVQITDAPVDGVVEVDLTQYEFAHLNAIKGANWQNVTVTDLLLYKEPVITPIELKLSEGDIAAAIAAAKAEIENKGDKVGNITVYMSKDANCTVGSTITAPNNITIWGNNATLTVAEGMTAPFITLDGTEQFAMKNETEASDHKLIENVVLTDITIKGLQNAIVKDNQKTLLNYLVILNCNIEMPASSKNVIDFNGKGYVGNVSVTNSTIWAKDKNTGFFAQYGSRPKNINETLTQDFLFVNSTIVNIANGKNMCDLKQNGTAQNRYSLLNSIFVDCGKENQVVVGLNKGQTSANPTWDVDGNYFAWGGKCVNEQEASKAGEGIVKNSVDGLLTFTDAAAGDFNGTFELAEGAKAPERLGDPRWTITYVAPAEPAGEVLYALTEGETFTSGQVVEVMDENKEAVATIQYGEAGEGYADFKAAKADGQVEGFTAFTEGNGTNGNRAGGTFYTIVPKYNGVISAGIVLNGGKAFHLTVDGVQNPVFDGNTLTNKYYGTFSFNVEAGKSYKFWCDGSKLGFYGFDYAWGPDVEPITEVGLNDETVGIATVKFDTTNGAIYNLNGQKMSGTLKSGLYIVNGKKVMVK